MRGKIRDMLIHKLYEETCVELFKVYIVCLAEQSHIQVLPLKAESHRRELFKLDMSLDVFC